jgi:hypothetical protein
LMLLDEPLAAVDELTRDVLQEELSQLWQMAGFTAPSSPTTCTRRSIYPTASW